MREVTQWIRALFAYLENPGLIPNTHAGFQTLCNSSLRAPNALLWTLQSTMTYINMWYEHTYKQTTHKYKMKMKVKIFLNYFWD